MLQLRLHDSRCHLLVWIWVDPPGGLILPRPRLYGMLTISVRWGNEPLFEAATTSKAEDAATAALRSAARLASSLKRLANCSLRNKALAENIEVEAMILLPAFTVPPGYF